MHYSLHMRRPCSPRVSLVLPSIFCRIVTGLALIKSQIPLFSVFWCILNHATCIPGGILRYIIKILKLYFCYNLNIVTLKASRYESTNDKVIRPWDVFVGFIMQKIHMSRKTRSGHFSTELCVVKLLIRI